MVLTGSTCEASPPIPTELLKVVYFKLTNIEGEFKIEFNFTPQDPSQTGRILMETDISSQTSF